MTGADIQALTAVDIIARSIAMHPTTFLEALQSRAFEDSRYAASRDNADVKRAVLASFDAAMRACDMVRNEDSAGFAGDRCAGVIALNLAGKLQGLSLLVRTRAAMGQWED